MRIGQFNLNWPWKWLQGLQAPGEFATPNSVQPVVEVGGQAWPPLVQSIQTSTALILGTNEIDLPRGPDIGRARLWSQLAIQLDIVTPGLFVQLFYFDTRTAFLHLITSIVPGGYVANQMHPLIGGMTYQRGASASGNNQGISTRASIYVPGVFQLARVRITGAAGTETAIVQGLFTEADENEPRYIPIP